MADLRGKTAFISAATSVVGRACASALAASGARLCLADADLAAARSLAGAVDTTATTVTALNSCDEGSWQQATAHCVAELGALDVLVHCDGCFDGSRAIIDTPLEESPVLSSRRDNSLSPAPLEGWFSRPPGPTMT